MSVESTSAADASIGELMSQLSTQTSRLVRDEMRLAQKELQQSVTPLAAESVESVKADIKEVKEARNG